MRIPNLNLGRYRKSFYKTQKVIRTITPPNQYIHKQKWQETENKQKIQVYLDKQKELENEMLEKLNDMIDNARANGISYMALLIYGIRLDKKEILEKLKARKAK